MSSNLSVWLGHPTGNSFVRALLQAFELRGLEYRFFTSLGFGKDSKVVDIAPARLQSELKRRTYNIPESRITRHPFAEVTRLAFQKIGCGKKLITADQVYQNLDRQISEELLANGSPDVLYLYEDGAFESFLKGSESTLKCYELPIAYWQTARKLLQEEAQRYPDWTFSLEGLNDRPEKLERKTRELERADLVVVPSQFVFDSLPFDIKKKGNCIVSPFGSPEIAPTREKTRHGKLRVLFAGTMSQRKGLADLLAAVKLLKSNQIELVVFGTALRDLEFYQSQADFTYEKPRPHSKVLELMESCDVLALPSILEGRALVQQEALSRGLPLVITANTGGEDLIEEGSTGFLVPIRNPEAIAGRLEWFIKNHHELPRMQAASKRKAAEYTWADYASRIIDSIERVGVLNVETV